MAPGNLLYQVILVLLVCSDDAASCGESVTITTPSPMTALRGSCLKIPCTYRSLDNRDINPATLVTGIWFKSYHRKAKRFSDSGDSRKSYPMNIAGDLKTKDCTTMFYNLRQSHEDKYYFRVQNRDFRATAICTHLRITVTDSAWSPSIEVSGDQTETEVVTITCSAVTPCPHAPPQLTWDLHQGTVNITETNPDGTITTKAKLNITLTDSHDGQMIKCSAAYPVSGGVKMADNNITLSVTYGPKDTSVEVSPSGSLSAGQSVTLSCSSRANPPVHNFTWFTHSSQGPLSVGEGHTYNFSICDGGDYYCVATNALGNESSPVTQLRITDAPWSPSIEVSGNQTENEVVTITCSAVTPCPHAPPQLTWDLHQGTVNITETNPDGTITTKIELNITLTDSHDGQVIKCSAAYPVSGGVKMTENNITLDVALVGKSRVPWKAILGAVIGVLTVIFLAVFVRCFKTKCQAQQGKQQEESVNEEETIHYGEIDFSKLKPKETSNHEDTELKEETVYSQVQVSRARPADEETTHYAEIDLSTLSPKMVPEKEQDETVYSELHESKSMNNDRQCNDGVDSLYANVKKN